MNDPGPPSDQHPRHTSVYILHRPSPMSEPAKAEDLDGDSLPLQHYSAAGFESVPNTFDDRDDARTPHDTTTARPLLDHTSKTGAFD